MPDGTNMGPGWEQDANGQWVYNPETANLDTGAPSAGDFTGTLGSLNYGDELEGSTLANDWEKYFDAYDPTKEQMLGRAATTDIGQLGEAWGLQSQQLGEQYQEQLGGLFAQAGTGTMDLMSSWGGGGQTMTGRKGRQRKRIGSETSRQAGAYGMGLRQARDTGQLGLQQATTDIYQGLESDIYGERQKWERDQRSNLNTLLGMDIWEGDTTSLPPTITEPGSPMLQTSGPGTLPPDSFVVENPYEVDTNIDIDTDTLEGIRVSICESSGGTWDSNNNSCSF